MSDLNAFLAEASSPEPAAAELDAQNLEPHRRAQEPGYCGLKEITVPRYTTLNPYVEAIRRKKKRAYVARFIGSGAYEEEAAWSPSALFASGEVGVWYDPSDLSTMWTDDGTTHAGIGDLVYRIDDKSGNGKHATQATEASRPVLRQTAGGLYYLEFDGVDDSLAPGLTFPVSQAFDVSLAIDPQAADFVMLPVSGTVYFGIGDDGSTSTTLGAGLTIDSEYFDNVLSTNTTRGQNYTSMQAANVWHGKATYSTADRIPKIGGVITSAAFPGPKHIYQVLYRFGDMSVEQMAAWTTYAGTKVGVTL